jgi:hypothetical protein
MRKWLTINAVLCLAMVQAQNIPIGEWRSHFSFRDARKIALAGNTIFCSGQYGLFTFDRQSQALRKWGKEDGLGDVGISALHYAEDASMVLIGYESGTLDLITSDGTLTTLSGLSDSPIAGPKRILDIVSTENQAFLATDIGVVKLDLANRQLIENYRNIGPQAAEIAAREVLLFQDSLYVVSEFGILAGALDDNLLDFNSWHLARQTEGIQFSSLLSHEDVLYALAETNDLWRRIDQWEPVLSFPESIVQLDAENRGLFALSATAVYEVLPELSLRFSDPLLANAQALLVSSDNFLIGTEDNGLLEVNERQVNAIIPSGPFQDRITKIKAIGEEVFALFGPQPENFTGSDDGIGFSSWISGQWSYTEIEGFYNITDVEKTGETIYFSSLGYGLINFSDGERFDATNTSFEDSTPLWLTSLASSEGQLWVSQYDAERSLHRWNGSWEAFAIPGSDFPVALLARDDVIWLKREGREGGGLLVYQPGNGNERIFTTTDGLPSSAVTDFTADTQGRLWISTSQGVAFYEPADFPFNDFGVTIPFFEEAVLFDEETIYAVETDGGDRVWFATDRGVWVLDRGINEIVWRFTRENSPLPDDRVRDFAYIENTGEMFILTEKGLVSYRSASSRRDKAAASVKVFPNPVNPGFTGVVGITGVAPNATVKITNLEGRIVASLLANGGTASWNLQTFQGSRAASGIYLIFSSLPDGSDTLVGKMAILE